MNRCLPDFKTRKLCSVVLKILKVVRFKVLRFKTNEVAQLLKIILIGPKRGAKLARPQ